MKLTDIPTAQLVSELQHRRAIAAAQVASLGRALGEGYNFQLPDAKLALDVASAIAAEANLESPFLLVERCRQAHLVTPRQLLHWYLREQHGWSYERIALHCERDHGTIMNSCKRIQVQYDHYAAIVGRIIARLQAATPNLQPS